MLVRLLDSAFEASTWQGNHMPLANDACYAGYETNTVLFFRIHTKYPEKASRRGRNAINQSQQKGNVRLIRGADLDCPKRNSDRGLGNVRGQSRSTRTACDFQQPE